MKARILWIEGKRAETTSFIPLLRKKDYVIESVSTGNAAITRLAESRPDVVVVNAASMRSNGKRICKTLREKEPSLPIIIILNPEQAFPGDPCANVILTIPFTVRKLINRITPLIPSSGDHLIRVGDICLDTELNRVRCGSKESSLTPRLVLLLQIFLQHPGEVQEREKLFSQIWNTHYTGDTRTLDVHISWLREAIEVDPRKPKYLKTIRRVGYRLDV